MMFAPLLSGLLGCALESLPSKDPAPPAPTEAAPTEAAPTEAAPTEAATEEPPPDPDRFEPPTPEAPAPFTPPTPARGRLSNGVEVIVVEDHDLPLVTVEIAFDVGAFTDPVGLEGLASSAMRMLDEGAGGRDAAAIAAAERAIAAEISTSAKWDSARIRLDALGRHLDPGLDLLTDLLLRPDFPAAEWSRLQRRALQDLESQLSSPRSLADRVERVLLFGDTYRGRLRTPESLAAIDVSAMRAWWAEHLTPQNALVLVGGDTSLDAILPALEARLGGWVREGADPTPEATPRAPEATTIYLVDHPGASQSVIRALRFGGHITDPDYDALRVANRAFGGVFSARLNLNLREDKGYTYGARSYTTGEAASPTWWRANAPVRADATAAAVTEILAELAAVAGERPFTPEEIADARANLVLGYPARFQAPKYWLGRLETSWRLDLPDDWAGGYTSRVEGVTPDDAQSAFTRHVAGQPAAPLPIHLLVVGDAASVREPLEALGYPLVPLNVHGNPTQEGEF